MNPIEFVRGRNPETGAAGPYQASEFAPIQQLMGQDSPSFAAAMANMHAYQNAGFVRLTGLSDKQVEELAAKGSVEADGERIASPASLIDSSAGVTARRAADIRKVAKALGLGEAVFALYGNPAVLTIFFPETLTADSNTPHDIGRRLPLRFEGTGAFTSFGLQLRVRAAELREYAGIELGSIPFTWERLVRTALAA